MNTAINHRRLDVIAQTIDRLEDAVLEAERAALDIEGDEATCSMRQEHVTRARAERDTALAAYFIEAEVVRRAQSRAA